MRPLAARTSYGSVRAFLIRTVASGWIEVYLPLRPNGSTGWVKASAVTVQPVADSVTVDLTARTITVSIKGKATTARAAVGSRKYPTPAGRFFVTDLVRSADPKGAYGPFAVGLSAHSETLSEFGGKDAQIGIHGTDDPSSIGRAVTHGCIRVPDAIVALLPHLELGTPVVIA